MVSIARRTRFDHSENTVVRANITANIYISNGDQNSENKRDTEVATFGANV